MRKGCERWGGSWHANKAVGQVLVCMEKACGEYVLWGCEVAGEVRGKAAEMGVEQAGWRPQVRERSMPAEGPAERTATRCDR